MDLSALRKWLAEPRTALVAAVAEDIRDHVAALKSRGFGFYGYALLPGARYDIHSLVVVTNREADIKASRDQKLYRYYRYSVNEWAHWDHDRFATANKLILEENKRLKSMHSKPDDDYTMDEFELAHANTLLDAVVQGLATAKHAGTFGSTEPFLAVWISDSDDPILFESVRQLNSEAVAEEFMAEFG